MVKKIVLVLTLLLLVTLASFAQVVVFTYIGNGREFTPEQFKQVADACKEGGARRSPGGVFSETDKLPLQITEAINKEIREYPLEVGDIFAGTLLYRGTGYLVYGYLVTIRITNVADRSWEFHAWLTRPNA
jgi:hypothetical protein